MCFLFVCLPVAGGVAPPANKLVGGSAIRVTIKMSKGHMAAGRGGKGRKTIVFRPLFLFLGSCARARISDTKTKPALSLTRRAGFRIM